MLYLFYACFGSPTNCTLYRSLSLYIIGWNWQWQSNFEDIRVSVLRKFALKRPIHSPFEGFWD